MAVLGRHRGVEFVLEFDAADPKKHDNWGVENPDQIAAWAQATMQAFRVYGEKMNVGQLNQFECLGSQHHAAVLSKADKGLCVGFRRTLTTDQIRETLKEIGIKWAS